MALTTTIKSIQDIMRKDVGVDGDAQRISQLGWMLFLKIFDDREQEAELLQNEYRSPIPKKLRWRNWAADPEGMTGDELLDFVNNELFRKLKNLPVGGNGDQRDFVVRNVFDDAYNYMKSGTLLRQVINKINESINFNDSKNRHILGDVYEQILKGLQSAGNAGEYYTPRAVTQFMVEMVDPKLGEKVLDPACGTGGFLTGAIEHIRHKYVKRASQEKKLQASISGVEKKPLPHLLCTTNMFLHGIDVPSNIRHDNTLSRPLRSYRPKERVDVVVTNPPFGGMEEDGIESNFPKAFRTRETADLFLVLIMHLLKPGGRAAMVLPDGTLFGEGVKTRIKEKLLDECNLHTIVRLPNGVFSPYTGIKTNLLFFTKGEPTRDVWYYEHTYPPGYKSYSKTKPIRIEEFEAEKKWWGQPDARGGFKGRKQNEHAWRVSAREIKATGYNLDIKNPHDADTGPGDPDELLAELERIRREGQQTLARLKQELAAALGGEPA
jgi:type I restriction enzyme M protein